MAGGMGVPRRGVPLKDRPVVTNPDPVQRPITAGRTTRHRHCFVIHSDHSHPLQGLVLQWAQDATGWVALTIFVVPRDSGSDLTVQEWVPADRLLEARYSDP